MLLHQNFYPQLNYVLAGTGASSTPQAIAQPANSTQNQPLTDFRIANPNSSDAFVAFTQTGTATATASGLNSVAVRGNSEKVFRLGPAQSIAVIFGTATATGNIYISAGEGQ